MQCLKLACAMPIPDRAFIDAMVPHDEQAIEAARVVLDQNERDELRRLARDIVEAQTREVQRLQEWRAAWF